MSLILNDKARANIRHASGPYKLVDSKQGTFMVNENDHYIGRSMLKYGQFLEAQCRIFASILNMIPHKIAIDVGANIGLFTIAMAKAFKDKGYIFAFEPFPLNYQLLSTNILLSGLQNISPYMFGLSNLKETRMTAQRTADQMINFGEIIFKDLPSENSSDHTQLKAKFLTLDDHFDSIEPGFIKIDAEYMEIKVIEGAKKTIMRSKPILYVENIFVGVPGMQHLSKRLIQTMWDIDYECAWHVCSMFEKDNFFGDDENIFSNTASVDMVCVPKHLRPSIKTFTAIKDLDAKPFSIRNGS
ncbi:MAG: FkbM family methyltransferase [Pseudomonadota bacterium]